LTKKMIRTKWHN